MKNLPIPIPTPFHLEDGVGGVVVLSGGIEVARIEGNLKEAEEAVKKFFAALADENDRFLKNFRR